MLNGGFLPGIHLTDIKCNTSSSHCLVDELNKRCVCTFLVHWIKRYMSGSQNEW